MKYGLAGVTAAAVLTTCGAAVALPTQLTRSTAGYVAIRALPTTLTLDNSRDVRQIVVSAQRADGYWTDVTDKATIKPAAPLVTRDAEGWLHPVHPGHTQLLVKVGALSAAVPLTVKSMSAPPVSFVREVMPILGRAGCNAGVCHGSAHGKNGFKLSLRGYDPGYDYHALVDDISGRRFNRARPADSLMLLKPTQGVAHQGGLVFDPQSRYYSLLFHWISQGVHNDAAVTKRANSLELIPHNPTMGTVGENQQILVIAHYPDGTTRDVTRDSVFSTTMKDVALVSDEGLVSGVRRGEAAILVRYEGNYAVDELTIIGNRKGYLWKPQPEYNYIDKLVDAKLLKVKALPSPLCTDAEFIRRASLDIVGIAPQPEAIRTFLSDPTPSRIKREALVDSLLNSPGYVSNWTNKWADLLDVNRKYLGEQGVWMFRNWIRDQVAQNRPYNQLVHDIIASGGSSYEHPAASYYRIIRDPDTATENVTQLFLGIRFSCNKCHDHPFERWTQNQYYQFAASFAQVGLKAGLEDGDEEVYDRSAGDVTHPNTHRIMTAGFPYSYPGSKQAAQTTTRREALANWLTSPQNPYFATSMANRVWSYFTGRGIIDPVDDIRSSNPPSNPALLTALTQDFIHSGFDLKHVMRTICLSRVYQSSIVSNRWNADDQINFSHAVPRRLTAEQLMDSIGTATGTQQQYPGVPVGFRAVQLPDTSVASGGFLDLFGRPPRQSPCECERSSTVSLGQALNLINGQMTNDTVADPKGRVAALVAGKSSDQDIVDNLYLAAWSRMPTAKELRTSLALFTVPQTAVIARLNGAADAGDIWLTDTDAKKEARKEAAQDLLWALLNSPEFLFNR